MRREKLHALPGKMPVQCRAQLPGLARADIQIWQQHHLLALQTQMPRIGPQPTTIAQPVKRRTDGRYRRIRLARHTE